MDQQFHFFQLFLFLLQIYLINYFMSKVEGLSAASDRAALLSFKSVVADRRGVLQGWTQNTSHCTWYGVGCSKKGARVRSLSLSGAGLSGPITSQLSNLSSLFMLDLSNNSFYGQIPSEFSHLSHLEYLQLRRNSINGTIPPLLSHCHNLKRITLADNGLTGNIPSELGYLQRLEILDFAVNALTGSIPVTFGNLTSLTNISLARNQLAGEIPSELGHLRNLRWIQLSENQFTGQIPYSIYNISSLVYISLTNNSLTGELPTDMGSALPNLLELYLATNRLKGMLPSSLFNASRIQHLDLSNNGFHGPVPDRFGSMKDIVYLNLGANSLSSSTTLNLRLFDSLINCTQLQDLRIFSNRLAGQFPASVANLSTQLQHFCVSDNKLAGGFPEGIDKFQELISLSIEKNSFVGNIPESIGSLKKLQNFLAYDNMFSGEIPDIFGNFTGLYSLDLGGNQFSGRIPASIGSCQRLYWLGLEMNSLNGSIPKEIFGLSTLIFLDLQRNDLSGPLPVEVGNLKQIQLIDMSDNQLSGNISSTIGSCSSLQNLTLGGNKFTGPIPSTISKLASLETLNLSSNSLTGTIPKELGNLRYLSKLNLSFNHLEGEVPVSGVFMNLSQVNLKGNNMLCLTNQTNAEKLELPRCNAPGRKKHVFLKIMIPASITAALLILFFYFLWVCISWKRQKNKAKGLSCPDLKGLPPQISYSDICQATDNFSAENLIGKGGFGSVYRGIFRNVEHRSNTGDTVLAVKVLDLKQSKAARSFEGECEILKNVRHRNLVKIITSCSSIQHNGEEFKALVMELMFSGNLGKWLYQEDAEKPAGLGLNLLQRLNIAIDVASAMDYLHHDCDPPIIHCDLKPENVLLDDDMVAHVGDFGLARFLSDNSSGNRSSTLELKGSIGYIAPEYGMGGKASTSGDVYSYGILLLEIFTAKKPTDEMFIQGLSLNKFSAAVNENHVKEIADPRLFTNNGYSSLQSTTTSYNSVDGISRNSISSRNSNSISTEKDEEFIIASAVRLGLDCAAQSAKDRLTMREALARLHKIKKAVAEI